MAQDDGTVTGVVTKDDVYRDRNLLAQLAAVLAQQCGLHVGTGVDAEEPDWPVIYIDLPSGQVSWHVPRGELVARLKPYGQEWDGHPGPEKERRIHEFLEQSAR